MIYTEEDLKQAYAMGYNEAVDDVNAYIEQDSMEFSLDESYDEDYSAVEDMVCNETSRVNKLKHNDAIENERYKQRITDGYHIDNHEKSVMLKRAYDRRGGNIPKFANSPYYHPQAPDIDRRRKDGALTKVGKQHIENRRKIFGN